MGYVEQTELWEQNRYTLQWKYFSISFGFLLLIGLCSNSFFLRNFVVLLILGTICYEASWLKMEKVLKTPQWRLSLILTTVSGIAYIAGQNYLLKSVLFWFMIVGGIIYLYRVCYPDTLSWNYIKQMFEDTVYLLLSSFVDIWRVKKRNDEKIRDRKIHAGLIGAIVVVVGILIPLYALADIHFREILKITINKIIEVAPILSACIVFGFIPAMFNYSFVKGLYTDVVLENPRRDTSIPNREKPGFYFNETTLKIIALLALLVNTIFVIIQIVYLMDPLQYNLNIEDSYRMDGMLPLAIAVIVNIIVIGICVLLTKRDKETKLHLLVFWDILSTIAISISILYRYYWKVTRYGIRSLEVISGLLLIVTFILLLLSLTVLIKRNTEIMPLAIRWISIAFVVSSLIPSEYLISQINVSVFLHKYNQETANVSLSQKDIDLEYLAGFKYQAIPAMARLNYIDNTYGETGISVGEKTRKYMIEILKKDLTNGEKEMLDQRADTEEKLNFLVEKLEMKSEYQMFGYKKQALESLRDMILK